MDRNLYIRRLRAASNLLRQSIDFCRLQGVFSEFDGQNGRVLAGDRVVGRPAVAGGQGRQSGAKEREINFSEFLANVDQGNVSEVTMIGQEVRGKFKNDKAGFHTTVMSGYTDMIKELRDKGVNITVKDASAGGWPSWLLNLAPFVLLGALWFIMIRQMQTGGNKALSFGKSRRGCSPCSRRR